MCSSDFLGHKKYREGGTVGCNMPENIKVLLLHGEISGLISFTAFGAPLVCPFRRRGKQHKQDAQNRGITYPTNAEGH